MPTGSSKDKENFDQASQDKFHRKFTWKELSVLNKPENAHVAYNGKVIYTSLSQALSHIFFFVLRFMMLVVLYYLILEVLIRL